MLLATHARRARQHRAGRRTLYSLRRKLMGGWVTTQSGPASPDGVYHIHGNHNLDITRYLDSSSRRFYVNSATSQLEAGTSSKIIEASDPPDLLEAILDLYNVRKVAEEDECAIPEKDALPKAERVSGPCTETDPRPTRFIPCRTETLPLTRIALKTPSWSLCATPMAARGAWSISMMSSNGENMTIQASYPTAS